MTTPITKPYILEIWVKYPTVQIISADAFVDIHNVIC